MKITSYDEEIYRNFMRYGEIIKAEDFDLFNSGFMTLKVFELDGEKRLFVVRNGELVYNEKL